MPNQPSTSDDSTSDDRKEPPRNGTIPDDFIWNPDTQSWYLPGEPGNWDQAAFSRELTETIRRVREQSIANGTWNNGTVIRLGSRPDAPNRMGKSPRTKPEHLPLFPDDDDAVPTKQELTPADPDGDEPSEEVS